MFLKHQGDLQAFVVSVVQDWNRADDIVQEVSLVLWRRFAEYDPSHSFGAWARGIAARKILKDRERQRQGGRMLSPEAIESVAAAYEEVEAPGSPQLEALQLCLRSLDPASRKLLDLRYQESLPLEEVATRTERSLAAVTKALLRLRSSLERCVRSRMSPGAVMP